MLGRGPGWASLHFAFGSYTFRATHPGPRLFQLGPSIRLRKPAPFPQLSRSIREAIARAHPTGCRAPLRQLGGSYRGVLAFARREGVGARGGAGAV